jgi:hypothetical protein
MQRVRWGYLLLAWLWMGCAVARPEVPAVTATPGVSTVVAPATVAPAPSPTATPRPSETLPPTPSATTLPSASPTQPASPTITATANFILWDEAVLHVNEETTVCGPVMDAKYSPASKGKPTFINLGEKYPNPKRFTVLIWGQDRDLFSSDPATLYNGQDICVTGKIESYQGALEIVVHTPDQIVINR